MKKYLKLILLTSFLMYFKGSVLAADSLKISKKYFQIELNYGMPIYNRLYINSNLNNDNTYSVKSKLKSYYELSLRRVHNNLNLIFSLSYLQSEFEGKEFKMNAYNDTIPVTPYNLYQHIKYNVLYANIGIGYNINFNPKHILNINLTLNTPTIYNITIDNMYSKKNQINDTTLFEASKNSKNWDTNFGHIPRISLSLSYNYFFTSQLALNLKFSFLYAYSLGSKYPEDYKYSTVFNNSNNYSFLAYNIRKQITLTPSIGISYKIN